MKSTKTFESIKDQSNIGDLLLEFEDSGEISDIRITDEGSIRILFDFNENLVGIDKLKVLDKIISRLRRKYPYIYINNNIMYIDLVKQDRKYITGSLATEVEDILKEKLTDLNIYTTSKYTDFICYGETKNNILLQYNKKDKRLLVDYHNGMEDIINMYMLEYMDIVSLWQEAVINKLQVEVYSTQLVSLDKHNDVVNTLN